MAAGKVEWEQIITSTYQPHFKSQQMTISANQQLVYSFFSILFQTMMMTCTLKKAEKTLNIYVTFKFNVILSSSKS